MPRVFKFFEKIFGYIFLFLDPFEILLHYDLTDSSHWAREDVQRILDKVFREELLIKMSSTLSSTFFYWIFGSCLFLLLFS